MNTVFNVESVIFKKTPQLLNSFLDDYKNRDKVSPTWFTRPLIPDCASKDGPTVAATTGCGSNVDPVCLAAAPQVLIMDENNHEVQDRYYKAGSSVELSCLATQVEEPGDVVSWRHGDTLITMGVSFLSSAQKQLLTRPNPMRKRCRARDKQTASLTVVKNLK
uniref:Ig-like domain-containing protein n=1 Tax=Timema cristinae TaxID=61476 RepID=A0A7R9DEH3_TIMCR|nr:unnamed protein product [Timema cristinae]